MFGVVFFILANLYVRVSGVLRYFLMMNFSWNLEYVCLTSETSSEWLISFTGVYTSVVVSCLEQFTRYLQYTLPHFLTHVCLLVSAKWLLFVHCTFWWSHSRRSSRTIGLTARAWPVTCHLTNCRCAVLATTASAARLTCAKFTSWMQILYPNRWASPIITCTVRADVWSFIYQPVDHCFHIPSDGH